LPSSPRGIGETGRGDVICALDICALDACALDARP